MTPAERDLYEADLRERVASLQRDVVTYRMMVQAALDQIRELTVARDRHREQHHRLLDEYRRLREDVLRRAA